MSTSRFDVIYRRALLSKFFTKGWGSVENYMQLLKFREKVIDRDRCYKLLPQNYPIHITYEKLHPDHYEIIGKFDTPLMLFAPSLIVPEVREAFFQMLIPLEWKDQFRPMCIHIGGTGDHYFWNRRYYMAKPLLNHGIGSTILENPYYGLRKPPQQVRSSLHYVSDIFVMGACLILECVVILNWCERLGFRPLGVSGISMGGHMASLAASAWPKPLVLVPCLSWTTASTAFTEGVLADAINWDILQKQLFAEEVFHKILAKSCKIVDSPFKSNLYYEDSDSNDSDNEQSYTPYDMMHLMGNDEVDHNLKKKKLRKLSKGRKRNQEALWFMRGVMDEFTHLKHFTKPFDTDLVISVCAKSDGYVPRFGLSSLEELWPGIEIRYIDAGHIGACLWHKHTFRLSIKDAFDKAKLKIS